MLALHPYLPLEKAALSRSPAVPVSAPVYGLVLVDPGDEKLDSTTVAALPSPALKAKTGFCPLYPVASMALMVAPPGPVIPAAWARV